LSQQFAQSAIWGGNLAQATFAAFFHTSNTPFGGNKCLGETADRLVRKGVLPVAEGMEQSFVVSSEI
jgi:hypothetical protein